MFLLNPKISPVVAPAMLCEVSEFLWQFLSTERKGRDLLNLVKQEFEVNNNNKWEAKQFAGLLSRGLFGGVHRNYILRLFLS